MHGGPGEAAGVLAHDLAEPAQLLGCDVTGRHPDLDGREALLPLALDVALEETIERALVAVGRVVAERSGRGVRLLVVLEQQLVE